MPRLPQVGGDDGRWGEILNDFLAQSHDDGGKLKTDSVGAPQLKPNSVTSAAILDGQITSAKIADGAVDTSQIADNAVTPSKLRGAGQANGVATLNADAQLPEDQLPARLGVDQLDAQTGEAIAAVVESPFIEQLKAGDAFIADRLSAAPAYNVPVISSSSSSQINGGVLIQATGDYTGDAHFRYNGCSAVSGDGTWVSPPSGQLLGNQILVPEMVTSEADFEVKMLDGRTGSIGLRVIVDGKLTGTWQMVRVTGTAGTARYLRLTFSDARTRHVQIEHDGFSAFGGVIAASGAAFIRPPREWKNRHVVVGDSLNAGAATYEYLKYESHSRLTAFLLGADFYMNLAVGGTGWVADNGAANPFSARMPVALSPYPQTLHVYGSRNDVSTAVATVRQAVIDTLALAADVANVIVGAVAQAGYDSLSDAIRQGVAAAGRTFVDINALAQSNTTAPQGHPTLVEQQLLGKAVYAQLDRARLEARAAASDATRIRPLLTLTTSGTPVATGTSVTLTATLSQALAGLVRFYDGTTLLGSAIVSGSTATFTTTALTVASHSITARFIPTAAAVLPATSTAVTQVVATVLGFDDDFNRADGVPGSPWLLSNSGPVIASNALMAPGITANRFCTRDAGTLWGDYEFTMAGAYAASLAMQFCHLNSNYNLFINTNGGSNYWRIYSRLNAVSTQIAVGTTSGVWAAGDVITVTFAPVTGDPNSADVTVKKNGTVQLATTRIDISAYSGSTFVGAGFTSSSTAAGFDRIRMIPV